MRAPKIANKAEGTPIPMPTFCPIVKPPECSGAGADVAEGPTPLVGVGKLVVAYELKECSAAAEILLHSARTVL